MSKIKDLTLGSEVYETSHTSSDEQLRLRFLLEDDMIQKALSASLHLYDDMNVPTKALDVDGNIHEVNGLPCRWNVIRNTAPFSDVAGMYTMTELTKRQNGSIYAVWTKDTNPNCSLRYDTYQNGNAFDFYPSPAQFWCRSQQLIQPANADPRTTVLADISGYMSNNVFIEAKFVPAGTRSVSSVYDRMILSSEISTMLSGNGLTFENQRLSISQNDAGKGTAVVVGSPSISQSGDMSGITTDSYAKTAVPFAPGTSPWKIDVRFRTGSDVATNQAVFGSDVQNYDPVMVRIDGASGKFKIDLSYAAGQSIGNRSGTSTVMPDSEYELELSFDGVDRYALRSRCGGGDWIDETSLTSDKKIYSLPLCFGIECTGSAGNKSSPFKGTIRLGGSSIQVDGQTWWDGYMPHGGNVAKASDVLYGLVKPDNNTININNGVISADFMKIAAAYGYREIELSGTRPGGGEFRYVILGKELA